ncbi:hypothetical protein LINGRAHAP2_LOCUS4065 [Linum grandiflorum]
MDEGSWHFDGVMLVTHELRLRELPDQVPLTQILSGSCRYIICLLVIF